MAALCLAGCDTICDLIHEYPDARAESSVAVELSFSIPPYEMYKAVTFDSRLTPTVAELGHEAAPAYTVPEILRPCVTVELWRGTREGRHEAVSRRRLFSERLWAERRETLTEHLEPGEYFLVAWGDYVPHLDSLAADDARHDEWLYRQDDLTSVELITASRPQNPHALNAQSAVTAFTVPSPASGRQYVAVEGVEQPDNTVHVALHRTQARIRIIATDAALLHALHPSMPLRHLTLRATYNLFVATGFNAMTQEPTDFISSYTFITDAYISSGTQGTDEVLIEYTFAPIGSECDVVLDLEFIADDGTTVGRANGLKIPVSAGYETIVKGPFLTANSTDKPSGLGIDEEFEGEYQIVLPY